MANAIPLPGFRMSHATEAPPFFTLPPVQRNFYMEHPAVAALDEREVAAWRRTHHIEVTGRAPKPVRTFIEAAFPEFITAELEAAGFRAPTSIQMQAWPIALSGSDLIGLANTGSGKTLSFVLPALVHIVAQDHLQAGDGPVALVLAPTRELAVQIKAECDRFGASSGVSSTAVYGGVPKGPQQRDLQTGVELVVATPGRLLDFLDAGMTNLRRATYLVLDEADRMLDLGFEPQLRRVMEQARRDRQTLMCSATWPREVERLAREWLHAPLMVTVDRADRLSANARVAQHFKLCNSEVEKHHALLSILGQLGAGNCAGLLHDAPTTSQLRMLPPPPSSLPAAALPPPPSSSSLAGVPDGSGAGAGSVGAGSAGAGGAGAGGAGAGGGVGSSGANTVAAGVDGAAAGEGQVARVIIFCASKRGCEAARAELRRRGISAEALHGDKSQQERDWVLQQFRQGSAPVLLATDVASRGLDVKDVRAVVNFDAPAQAEDYVHRIGRAGRAGASGEAYTLLGAADAPFAREVAAMQRRNGESVARELLRFCDNGPGRGSGGGPPDHSRRGGWAGAPSGALRGAGAQEHARRRW